MNKKIIVVLITIIFVTIFSILFNRCSRIFDSAVFEETVTTTEELTIKYDLNKSPKEYSIEVKENEEEYLNFIKNNLYPEKLRNFVEFNKQHFDTTSGDGVLDWMKFEAYKSLFYQLFSKDYIDYSECPVTINFKSKFKDGLYKYFELKGEEHECRVFDIENRIEIEDRINVDQYGDAEYSFLHHFHYTLDEEGNVDDIIFDYTGWD